MENKYIQAEKALKTWLESFGNIAWAKPNDESLVVPYKKLVDIFGNRLGNNLSDDEKNDWVKTMIRNSGYSEDIEFKNRNPPFLGVSKPPMTISDSKGRGKSYHIATSIYPLKNGFPSKIHEGIHFLSLYGLKRKRIIKNNKDAPLANIMGNFFRFMKHPKYLREIVGITNENEIEFLEQNPFLFKYNEHSDEEHFEAGITAANAYFIAKKQGEQAGINYIINLMEEAMLCKSEK